jgi:hypothetical protein
MHVSKLVEPYVSFHHARLKIEWAKHNIEHLDRLCKAFVQSNPHFVTNEPDLERGGYRFQAGMSAPMDCRIGLLAGDICGNLRASLDYAWMGLVRAHSPGQGEKRTLPIADNRKGLIKIIEQAPIGSALEQSKILLGNTIQTHRDFADGGNRPISILNELSNWNKHNMLAITTGLLHMPTMTDNFGNVFIGMKVSGYIDPSSTAIKSQGQFKYQGKPALEIVFGKHDGIENDAVVPTLINLSEATTQAVEAFCEIFGMPAFHN